MVLQYFFRAFLLPLQLFPCLLYCYKKYEDGRKAEGKKMEKRKIIMDCDPGVDDGIALAYLAANRDKLSLLAVTTVSGNQTVEKATKNALDLLTFYGMDVPVARGMDAPLIREAIHAPEYHGENGIGECSIPAAEKGPEKENAVLYLKKILSELEEGEKATLAVTGPMTNIALLLKLFPEVKEKIQEIVFMGGAACGGNVTPSAEFNIYADPEAAKIVFRSGVPLVMCGLDTTLKCTLTRQQILKLCQSDKKVPKLCGDMVGFTLENTSEKYRGKVSVHDAVTLMYLLHPEIFTVKKTILDVDCSEGISRGTTLCDFRWWEHDEEDMTSLILMDADESRFQEELITALYEVK